MEHNNSGLNTAHKHELQDDTLNKMYCRSFSLVNHVMVDSVTVSLVGVSSGTHQQPFLVHATYLLTPNIHSSVAIKTNGIKISQQDKGYKP